jgi:hypothetical protein
MTILCHCREISDTDLKEAFETFRDITYGGKIENFEDLQPLLGDYNCGGCSRIFDRAAQQFNETGEINLFKRSRRAREEKAKNQSGLCSYAAERKYDAMGIPDLSGSPIETASPE